MSTEPKNWVECVPGEKVKPLETEQSKQIDPILAQALEESLRMAKDKDPNFDPYQAERSDPAIQQAINASRLGQPDQHEDLAAAIRASLEADDLQFRAGAFGFLSV